MADLPPELTVLVPVFNEAGNLAPLADEIAAAMNGSAFEMLFVDDGSSDGSASELAAIQARHANARVMRHKKRAGKSAALLTGFHAARGTWIQTLDGGRPERSERCRGIVVAAQGIAAAGAARSRSRRAQAAQRRRDQVALIAYRQFHSPFDVNDATPDTGCGFKLIRREVAVQLPFFDGMHRFLPALTRRAGFDIMQTPVEDRPRKAGKSKYGFFGRLGAGIVDLLGVFWLMRRGTHAETEEILRQ